MIVSGFCNDAETLTWALYDDGKLLISGTGAMTDYSSTSSLPWYSYRSKLKSIVIDDGVTHIGKNAFYYCYYVTSVSIADSVTSIGDYAFEEITNLTSVTLPANLTSIGSYAFRDCSKLTSVTIPASVTSIGIGAFHSTAALTEVIVEEGNTAYSSENGVLFNADKTSLILYPAAKADESYVIPETVTTLSAYAFYYVKYLTSLTLPASLTTVEANAVYYGNVKNIIIDSMNAVFDSYSIYANSSSVTFTVHDGSTAEFYAKEKGYTIQYFDGETDTANILAEGTCGEELTWKLDENGLLVISGEGDMEDYFSKYNVPWYDYNSKVKTIVVEEGVTSIGDYAFYDCGDYLTSVTLADSITSIGNYVFYYCNEVKTINLPANLVSIGKYAFSYMDKITEFDLPDTLESIGESAFYDCDGIKSVRIPEGVTSIGNSALAYCLALERIVVDADNVMYSSEDGVLYDKGKTILYNYPAKSALTSYEIPDTVTQGQRIPLSCKSRIRYYPRKCNVCRSVQLLLLQQADFRNRLHSRGNIRILLPALQRRRIHRIRLRRFHSCGILFEVLSPLLRSERRR